MRSIIIALAIIFASATYVSAYYGWEEFDLSHEHDKRYEAWDFGPYVDFKYEINDNVEIGNKNSYEAKRKEGTSLFGITFKWGGDKNKEESDGE